MSGAISITTAVIAVGIAAEVASPFAVIAAVGAVVGAVGAVTKVKELQYAGMAIGAVGLVGGIASSLNAFGEAGLFGGGLFGESAAGAAGSSAGDFANVMGQGEAGISGGLSSAGTSTVDGGLTAGSATSDAVMQGGNLGSGGQGTIVDAINANVPNATPPVPDTAAAPSVAPAATDAGTWGGAASADPTAVPATPVSTAGQVTGGVEPPSAPQVGQPATAANPADFSSSEAILDKTGPSVLGSRSPTTVDVAASSPPAGQTAMPGSGVTGQPTPSGIAGVGNSLGGQTASSVAGAGSSSTWDSISNFVNKNPMMMFGAMQTAGKFMQGAFGETGLTEPQIAELNARAEQNRSAAAYYDAQSALLKRRVDNLSQPLPTANRTPIVRPTGLINSQYATGGVTGQVA